MLRELQTAKDKNIDAMYKADVAMVTGMAVVKNMADKTADMPAAATVDGIFLVNKERIPTGINTARTDMSDYDDDFCNIKVGEPVKLIPMYVGERYATDACVATGLTVGDALMVGVDGKFAKATKASTLIYGGTFNDAGHTLHIVEKADHAVTNA
ncbi:MAG: hypothetical protein WCR36_09895 [Bacteroidaceae bacterium]